MIRRSQENIALNMQKFGSNLDGNKIRCPEKQLEINRTKLKLEGYQYSL